MKARTTSSTPAVSRRSKLLRCSLPLLGSLLLPALSAPAALADSTAIDRQGESRLFYSTIKVPANAEYLLLSGIGASPLADGSWGDMEQQTAEIFERYKGILAEQGWSLSDIVQVRVFALADDAGRLDFEGFNRGYLKYFGSDENPQKPVRAFVQVADLVREGWLVEVEIMAARVPAN